MKKKNVSKKLAPPAKSAGASTSPPRRESGRKTASPNLGTNNQRQQADWTKEEWNAFGEAWCRPFAMRYEALKEFVGDWDDDLTDDVFMALYVKRERKHRRLAEMTKENFGKETFEDLPRDTLDWRIKNALDARDADFIVRLGKCMIALKKLLPSGLSGPTNPADRITAVDTMFIVSHWMKRGSPPEQWEIFDNRDGHWEYLGRRKPIILASGEKERRGKTRSLPTTGIYEFIARTPGRPAKSRKTPTKL